MRRSVSPHASFVWHIRTRFSSVQQTSPSRALCCVHSVSRCVQVAVGQQQRDHTACGVSARFARTSPSSITPAVSRWRIQLEHSDLRRASPRAAALPRSMLRSRRGCGVQQRDGLPLRRALSSSRAPSACDLASEGVVAERARSALRGCRRLTCETTVASASTNANAQARKRTKK